MTEKDKKISFGELNIWLKMGIFGGFLYFIGFVLTVIMGIIEKF